MQKKHSVVITVITFFAFLTFISIAFNTQPAKAISVPHLIGYEGQLTDSSGTDLTGTYAMTFRIYDAATGGNLLWTEVWGSGAITATDGYFSVQLGSSSTLDLAFDKPYWISIQVESDSEMTPRQQINSTGYSYVSNITYGAYATGTTPATSTGALYYDTDDGNLFLYDGIASAWVDLTSAGISSLGGLTTSTQTFATSTATSTFTIASSGSVHTLTIPSNVGFFSNDSGYITTSTALTVSNFATTSISQWNNDSGYVTSTGVSTLNSLSGGLTIAGTNSEVDVTDNASDTITIGLPDTVTISKNAGIGASSTASTFYGLDLRNNVATSCIAGCYGLRSIPGISATQFLSGTTTLGVSGVYARVDNLSAGTIVNAYNILSGQSTGNITNNYGIYVQDQTIGTNDYGVAIEGADTYALWISSAADNTDAANGITFGLSGDTNLYRSAADTLYTDDGFTAAGTSTFGGNVSIGTTTSPTSYALEVTGDVGVDQFIYRNGDGNTYARFLADRIQLQTGGNLAVDIDEGGAENYAYFGDSLMDTELGRVVFVGGSEGSYNGLVGIGTTTPAYALHVEGDLYASATTTLDANVNITGTTPILTIGDGAAEDTSITFDGNAIDATFGIIDSSDFVQLGNPYVFIDPFGSDVLTSFIPVGIGSGITTSTILNTVGLTVNQKPGSCIGGCIGIDSTIDISNNSFITGTEEGGISAIYGQVVLNTGAGTVGVAHGLFVDNPVINAGAITNNVGIYIDDQTVGTTDYGIAIEGADTYALWISSAADNTDAANGITFGLSGDTNLYRAGASSLKTDDSFNVAGVIKSGLYGAIGANGSISAAYGLDLGHDETSSCLIGCYGLRNILEVSTNSFLSGSETSGTIVNYGKINETGSGTITNGYTFYADNPAGNITNNYALYVNNQTTGVTTDVGLYIEGADTYAIHVASSTVRFDGTVEIGAPATANTTALCWDNSGNSNITDCNGSATDLAENFGTSDLSIEAGDIVSYDTTRPAEEVWNTDDNGTDVQSTKAWVVKSSSSNDRNIIGVISTSPNQVFGEDGLFTDGENPVPVSLAGRLPVKVTSENGKIRIGDFITSSSIDGVGMRSTGSGKVVGMAISNWESDDVNEIGSVIVFVNPTFWLSDEYVAAVEDGSLSAAETPGKSSVLENFKQSVFNGTVKALGPFARLTDISGQRLADVSDAIIEATSHSETYVVAENSVLEQENSIGGVRVTTYSLQSSRDEVMISGEGRIKSCSDYSGNGYNDCNMLAQFAASNGDISSIDSNTAVGVVMFDPSFSALLDHSKPVRVLVTPTSRTKGTLYVEHKSVRGFVVESNEADTGVSFDWIIIGTISDGNDNLVEVKLSETNIISDVVSSQPNETISSEETTPTETASSTGDTVSPDTSSEETTPTETASSTGDTAPAVEPVIEPEPVPTTEPVIEPNPTPITEPIPVIEPGPAPELNPQPEV